MGQLELELIRHQFGGFTHVVELLLPDAEGLLVLINEPLSDIGVPRPDYLLLDTGEPSPKVTLAHLIPLEADDVVHEEPGHLVAVDGVDHHLPLHQGVRQVLVLVLPVEEREAGDLVHTVISVNEISRVLAVYQHHIPGSFRHPCYLQSGHFTSLLHMDQTTTYLIISIFEHLFVRYFPRLQSRVPTPTQHLDSTSNNHRVDNFHPRMTRWIHNCGGPPLQW